MERSQQCMPPECMNRRRSETAPPRSLRIVDGTSETRHLHATAKLCNLVSSSCDDRNVMDIQAETVISNFLLNGFGGVTTALSARICNAVFIAQGRAARQAAGSVAPNGAASKGRSQSPIEPVIIIVVAKNWNAVTEGVLQKLRQGGSFLVWRKSSAGGLIVRALA